MSNNHTGRIWPADRRLPTPDVIQPDFCKNGVIYILACMGVGRILSRGALVDLFKSFSEGDQKW